MMSSFFATIIFLIMPDLYDSGALPSETQGQKPIFSFGVVTDVQYCDCDPTANNFYRSSPGKLREALNTFEAGRVSFVINLGDLIDRDFGSFGTVMNIIDSSGLKFHHVTGNHDYSVERRFKKRLPVLESSKQGYYSFKYENFRFIVLNGNESSTYISDSKAAIKSARQHLAEMKAKGEINAVDYNGEIGSKQLEWLRAQLDEAVSKSEKVFLLCHFPLLPENVHNLLNNKQVLALLANYHNIISWFNGHNHSGNYANFNMIHFVTFKGMVDTGSGNSYAIVDVYKNKLWIRGSGRERSQILAY
jgi:manganese-dependent ADP-ribose/CDP-alcohol diphosphatase